VVATKANATAALGILSFIEEFSTRKAAIRRPGGAADIVPPVDAAKAGFSSLLSPIGFNRMCQENAGAEKCNKRGGQLKHGNHPYAEMRPVKAALLKAPRFRMVSSPRKNGFVAAIPRLSYFWQVCVAAGTHGGDTWTKTSLIDSTHAQVAANGLARGFEFKRSLDDEASMSFLREG
jgi:hypothetical protein